MPKNVNSQFLYKFSYPPYKVLINESKHWLIACGGGGASKSGVPNEMEIHEYAKDESVSGMKLNFITKRSSGSIAIMSMDQDFSYIVCAESNSIREYIILTEQLEIKQDPDTDTHVRDRRKSESESHKEEEHVVKLPKFELNRCLDNIFEEENQEITHICYGGFNKEFIVAGGTNGFVKIIHRFNEDNPVNMGITNFKICRTLSTNTLTDSPDNKIKKPSIFSLSCCLDHLATVNEASKFTKIWNATSGNFITQLSLDLQDEVEYKIKQSKYCSNNVYPNNRYTLITTHSPCVINKTKPSYLCLWNCNTSAGLTYRLLDRINLGRNHGYQAGCIVPISCCASQYDWDVCLVAIGSGEGQIDVYKYIYNRSIHSSNQKLSKIYSLPGAHSFFITDLSFVPLSNDVSATNERYCHLFSIGVDNMLRHHSLDMVRHRPVFAGKYKHYNWLKYLALLFAILWSFDRFVLILFSLI